MCVCVCGAGGYENGIQVPAHPVPRNPLKGGWGSCRMWVLVQIPSLVLGNEVTGTCTITVVN